MKTQTHWLNLIFVMALLAAACLPHHAQAANKPIHMPKDSPTGKSVDAEILPQPTESPQADRTYLLIDQRTGKPFPGQPQSRPDPNVKSPAFLRAQQQCHAPLSRPADPKYRDLTGVVLDVYVPGRYIEAQKCLGREEACIDESRVGEGKRKEALNDLMLRTKAYRPAIHVDNLVKIFSDMLRQNLMPYVLPDQNCKAPDLVVMTGGNVEPYERAPNILTVKVDVTIIDDTKPPIAVLTMGTYRLDPSQKNIWVTIPGYSTAVPLDLSDEQITARIKYFAQSSLVVWNEKSVVH